MPKTFIDTNILVYGIDVGDPKKHKRAQSILRTLAEEGSGVISTQVMEEFYVVATRKLGVDPLKAKGMLHTFENLEIVTITPSHVKDAIDCSILNKISFWDAVIVVAAESAKCEKIWTEDLNSGQIINGVRIEHPLSAHFIPNP